MPQDIPALNVESETPAKRAPAAPVLRTLGLTKHFGKVAAARDLSFELKAGETLALVGPNGAGKTTTLRMLATLLTPDSGEVMIMGQSSKNPFGVRHFIGYMPDVLGVYPEMLVGEYLEFFARSYEIDEHLIGFRIRETSAFLGIENLLDAPTDRLSRGMLQRVSLARAILHDPPVLLLDEPASGLDPRSRAEFRHILQELRWKGKSAIISSHVLSDLEETCTRIAMMDRGRIQVNEEMGSFLHKSRKSRTIRVNMNGKREQAQQLLSGRPDISNLRWDGETLLFELAEETRAAKLLRSLVMEGIDVEGFAEIPFSLEQAYLARTSGENM